MKHDSIRAIDYRICATPMWTLLDYFSLIEAGAARRLVAPSSSMCSTKVGSEDTVERAIAVKRIKAKALVQSWIMNCDVELSVCARY